MINSILSEASAKWEQWAKGLIIGEDFNIVKTNPSITWKWLVIKHKNSEERKTLDSIFILYNDIILKKQLHNTLYLLLTPFVISDNPETQHLLGESY